MIDLDITLSGADLERLTANLNLSRDALNVAAKRAARKMADWTTTQALRKMSAELRIQQKLLRGRFKIYAKNSGLEQKLWLGMNAFAAERLGPPVKRNGGTQVGKHFFDGAFPIRNRGVFRRTTADRFPIERVGLEIDEVAESALRATLRDAEPRMLELLRQELNYEVGKVVKGARI